MSIAVPPLAYNQTLFRSCYLKVHTRFYASSHSATTVNADQHNANVVSNKTRLGRGTKSGELKTLSAIKAAKGQVINTRNPLDENKLEGHLRSVAAAGSQITLRDVEGYRPQTQPSTTSLEYESQYNLLVKRLVRSFSLEQLTQVLELYHLPPPPKPTKRKCARSIVEQEWNWPSLADVRRKKIDSEFSSKSKLLFPLHIHRFYPLWSSIPSISPCIIPIARKRFEFIFQGYHLMLMSLKMDLSCCSYLLGIMYTYHSRIGHSLSRLKGSAVPCVH